MISCWEIVGTRHHDKVNHSNDNEDYDNHGDNGLVVELQFNIEKNW